jgi:glycine/D-amino acid oxidase-like deaminating enzyme
MSLHTAEVVICGAGIAGVAAAYHLAVRRGITDVALVDERPPLTLTSDKSTECYRNWWPGPGDDMVALMNRSIDLLEDVARESGNVIRLNRRGYLFATADPARVAGFVRAGQEAAARGVGPLRLHDTPSSDYRPAPADGFEDQPTGTDVISDPSLIRRHFPYLAEAPSRSCTRAGAAGSAASSSACTCSNVPGTRACPSWRAASSTSTRRADACAACACPGVTAPASSRHRAS